MDQTFRKIWGRRQARPLKSRQKRLLEGLFPQIQIALEQGVDLGAFPVEAHWLEIGFGGGEHLAYQAGENPQVGIIGCEPFVNGIASLLGYIEDDHLTNVRIVQDDARLLLEKLPDQSLEKIFVLFPDPWPKKRHQKRRIVNEETVNQFFCLLKPGGWLILATDIEDYGQWMQEAVEHQPGFVLKLEQRDSIHQRPSDWHVTRYEQKGLDQGRQCTYLTYQKCKE